MEKENIKKGLPKRIVVFAVLIATLSAAVYLNWQYTANNGELDLTATLEKTEKYLGDAEFVNSDISVTASTTSADFFSQSRAEREQTYKSTIDTLTAISNNATADTSAKQEAAKKISELAKISKLQSDIEALIKSKGFSDCVVIINDSKASAIVKAPNGLENEQTLQIQDIFLQNSEISLENIKIIEVK